MQSIHNIKIVSYSISFIRFSMVFFCSLLCVVQENRTLHIYAICFSDLCVFLFFLLLSLSASCEHRRFLSFSFSSCSYSETLWSHAWYKLHVQRHTWIIFVLTETFDWGKKLTAKAYCIKKQRKAYGALQRRIPYIRNWFSWRFWVGECVVFHNLDKLKRSSNDNLKER